MLSHAELRALILIGLQPGIGPVRTHRLLESFGSAVAVVHSLIPRTQSDEKEVDRILSYTDRYRISILHPDDPSYPQRLKQCYDHPLLLYYIGSTDLNPSRALSVIGTRIPSEYGREQVRLFIEGLQDYDVQIVSGLADGIDGLAHEFAMQQGLPTVAVLAHGLQTIYPADHRELAKRMVSQGGLLTEFPPGTEALKQQFPIRNRIIAGLSDAILLIESNAKGGSLITTKFASNYSREVFAIPGRVSDQRSRGCNELIRDQGANLVTTARDLTLHMNWKPMSALKRQRNLTPMNQQETELLNLFPSENPISWDELLTLSGMNNSGLATALLGLELGGRIEPLPGKRYQRLTV